MKEKFYAVKILRKYDIAKRNQINQFKTEHTILKHVDCNFIVKLYYAFQTNEKVYLIMEFMIGGKKKKIF